MDISIAPFMMDAGWCSVFHHSTDFLIMITLITSTSDKTAAALLPRSLFSADTVSSRYRQRVAQLTNKPAAALPKYFFNRDCDPRRAVKLNQKYHHKD